MRLNLLLLLFVGFFAYANELSFGELRFITVNEAPANYINEEGVVSGYVVDIVKQLQIQLKIDTDIEVMPEARAIHTLNTEPNVVMFSISRTTERELKYHWLARLLTKRWILYSKANSSYDISSIKDIASSQVVGTIRGDVREKWLQDQKVKKLKSITSYGSAIKMLMAGRIDFLLYESFGVFNALKEQGYQIKDVKPQYIANTSDVYIVMSKSEGSEIMAKELQKRLNKLLSSDWYKNHLQKGLNDLNSSKSADAWIDDGVLQY